jgi:hypothetical protein
MKLNKWTIGLAAVGVVSLASTIKADEAKMSQLQTALSTTTISGYVDTAMSWRPGTDRFPESGAGPSGNIPVYSFAKNDGFSLNAIDIAIDRPMDESPWAAGYHIELMAGPDAVPASATGSGAARFGFDSIRQAYVALRTPLGNGIDWKIGIWDTIIGYEATSSPLDPNYTRSYGYTIEPTTHSGVLGTYKVNDMISVSAGIANNWSADSQSGPGLNGNASFESQKTYMGAIALTAPDSWGWLKGATMNAGFINAINTDGGSGRFSQSSYYAGFTLPTPVTALKVGGAFDYYDAHSGNGETWVIGLYTSYQMNDKLSLSLRGEYLEDDTGNVYGFNSAGVARNSAEEFTATLQYNLWANVISRAEFRWDHVEHGNSFGNNGSGSATRSNDFLLAYNLIYQF